MSIQTAEAFTGAGKTHSAFGGRGGASRHEKTAEPSLGRLQMPAWGLSFQDQAVAAPDGPTQASESQGSPRGIADPAVSADFPHLNRPFLRHSK